MTGNGISLIGIEADGVAALAGYGSYSGMARGEAWKVMKQLQDIYWPNEVELPTPATIVSVSPTTTPMVLVMVISGFPELFVVLSPSSVGSFSFSITLNKNIDATINSCN